jgi:diguanylate cyclase (GGDEF)-like protein/PAS domain S-box-containing protein
VSPRRRIAGFLCSTLALGVAFFAFPGQRLLIWILIGLLGAGAVAAGVRTNRPRRRSAWWLIATSLLVLTISEATHFAEAATVDRGVFPGIADVLYLAGFIPLLVTGVWRLARSGVRDPDRAGLLDTLIVTTAVAVVSWAFLISPLVLGNTYTVLQKAVAVGYPVSGVLVLAAIVRLAAAARWTPAVVMPVFGTLGLLGASAAYGVGQLQAGWRVGGLVVVGWLVVFAGWGAGALHPAMRELTAPRAAPARELTRPRLVALAIAAMIAPLALLIEATRGMPPDITVRRALIAALFVLVLLRLYTAVAAQLRGAARERGLRGAGASLVEATTTEEVVTAVHAAVERLLPAGAPHDVVVEIGGTVSPTEPAAGIRASGGSAFETGRAPAPPVARPTPPAVPAGSIHPLDAPLAGQPGIPGAVLRCQMSLPRSNDGNGHMGALYVAADEALLVELQASVEVLASQAAMALERIRLTEEVNRRASEEYFRTLVHNAADVILIVDEDDTVRYASPSAATVLGVERAGRLQDLVPPEDRDTISQSLQLLRRDPQVPVTADWAVLAADGRRLQAEAVLRDLRADRTVSGIVITLRDVTERRRLERELAHLAFHDPLTGLANRSLLRERMQRALAHSRHEGTVVGMLILDVDDLKVINDTLGHAAGDELLVATGKRLAGALRQHDTAARLGGDEFAALVADARSPREIEQVAQHVVASFVEPFSIAGQLVSRAVSVGVATTADARNGEELMRHADLALYVAKSAGKAQWRRYGEAPSPALPLTIEAARVRPVARGGPAAGEPEYPPEAAAAPLGPRPPFGGRRGSAGLVARATGLIVPVGSWMLEAELAGAASRRFPVTLGAGPPLRAEVSAAHLRHLGSLATVRIALEAVATSPYGLVQMTEHPFGVEQGWVDLAALHMLAEAEIDRGVREPTLLLPHRTDGDW